MADKTIKITGYAGNLPVVITWRTDGWLSGWVEVDLSSAVGSRTRAVFPFALDDNDTLRFVRELRQLHETLEGDAVLGEYVGSCLTIKGMGQGKLTIDYTWTPVSTELRAEFALRGLDSDQSCLPDMIRQFEGLVK